jgi:hypothetical protein
LAGYKVGSIPGDRSKLKEGAGDTISPELDGRKITAIVLCGLSVGVAIIYLPTSSF